MDPIEYVIYITHHRECTRIKMYEDTSTDPVALLERAKADLASAQIKLSIDETLEVVPVGARLSNLGERLLTRLRFVKPTKQFAYHEHVRNRLWSAAVARATTKLS